MTLNQLRNLRENLDRVFYYSFDNLTPEQRGVLRTQIDDIDAAIRKMMEF